VVLVILILSAGPREGHAEGKGQEGQAQGKGQQKVTICHIPPGNPSKAHTLTLPEPAVQAHLKHGDTLGPCGPASHHPGSSAQAGAPAGQPGTGFAPPTEKQAMHGKDKNADKGKDK